MERLKKYCVLTVLTGAIIVMAFPAMTSAREWAILGPRALGMGGANVAVANDCTASYWNPAAYGFFGEKAGGDYSIRDWSFNLSVGAGASTFEGLEDLDEISDYDFDVIDDEQVQAENVVDYVEIVSSLESFSQEDVVARVSADAQFGVQIGPFGIGGTALAEIATKAEIDTVNIAPKGDEEVSVIGYLEDVENFNGGSSVPEGNHYLDSSIKADLIATIAAMDGWNNASAENYVQALDYGLSQTPEDVEIPADIADSIETVAQMASNAETGGPIEDNESKILFQGIGVFEVPLTYGRTITDDLAVGGNVKFMKARTYNVAIPVFDNDFDDALDEAMDDYEESSNFGIDLGVLYRFGNDLRVGMVARNVNSPSFDMKKIPESNDDSIEEEPQVRAGLCYKPLRFVTLACDYDLTKNSTTLSGGYKSQNLALGAEVNLFKILDLRIGTYKNLAEDDIGWVYTAGLGLNLWLLKLDVGAAMASETQSVGDDDYPKEVRGEFALSMLF